ncbi:MAG TPA: alpha/beta hydrolase [Myxococcota bacterium]|nr:alpha/beta hydrolase [Myxococcota bacterium]
MTLRGRRGLAALATLALLFCACATPIGTRLTSPREVYSFRTRSALSSDEPSDYTLNLLRQRELLLRFREDAAGATAMLHDAALAEGFPTPELYALSELSFLLGQETGDRARFAACAIYAYAFLFPEDGRPTIGGLDARERVAAELYNRALVLAFPRTRSGTVDLEAPPLRELPFGSFEVERDPSSLRMGGYELYDLLPVSEIEIRGLQNRYWRSGIGAPLAAKARLMPGAVEVVPLGPHVRVPITVVVTIPAPIAQLRAGAIRARVQVVPTLEQRSIAIDGRDVPLEAEPSAALAAGLVESAFWKQELGAFLGDAIGLRGSGQLGALRPYKRDRIPAVFIHGTASSAPRWADMVNDLLSDPRLSDRYAFWFFSYDSGNPIPYSGYQLRAALTAAVERADPSGKDPCVRDMIVLGHSQGGLLTKLTAIDSGSTFWDAVSSKPFAEAKLPAKEKDMLGAMAFVKPLPFVRTVIFLATPHRGSYLAGPQIVRRLAARLVRLPSDVVRLGVTVARLPGSGAGALATIEIPTSIDNMSPNHRFIKALASIPVAPGVDAHSIIAVDDPSAPLATAGDGVVKYASAHVDGVASELVVTSPHSGMQAMPATIEEVRRIFLEHSERSACPQPEAH